MKGKIFSAVFIAAFLFSVAVAAQPGRQGNRMERGEMMMKRHQNFKADRASIFTDEQKEQVQQIRLETAKKVKPLRNELHELMARQQTLTTADDASLKAINANIEKMADVKTEIAKLHAAQHQEIRSLLNEEQLLKFDQRKGRMGKGNFHGMRGNTNLGPGRNCPGMQG